MNPLVLAQVAEVQRLTALCHQLQLTFLRTLVVVRQACALREEVGEMRRYSQVLRRRTLEQLSARQWLH